MQVNIESGPADIEIRKLELIVNNEIVAKATQIPKEFITDEIEKDFMAGEHWIKARLTYVKGGREVVVESPYYRNPWWPYRGAN
ncbi:MAG: hypothetical protein JJU13_12300 [Balneolaceae bacterium]|nr:hypothetical protein [Balneolaceae bacterium]